MNSLFFFIHSFNKEDKTLANIARIAKNRLGDKYDITIAVDNSLEELEGKIENGVISAGSYSELLNTLGRFVRNPEIKNGTFKSKKEICAMYFASHNNNFYQCAPLEEIYEHIDDIALWGTNMIRVWFDMYFFENMEDGVCLASLGSVKDTILDRENLALKLIEFLMDWKTVSRIQY